MRVLVLMPTYNRAGMIAKGIESFLEQDHADKHLYIYDDGSTDNTAEVVGRYMPNAQITYIKDDTNRGQCYALNKCMSQTDADLACWLHSDDMFDGKDSLSKRVAVFSKMADMGVDVDMVYTDAVCEDVDGKVIERWISKKADASHIWVEEYIHFLTMMWRVDFLKKIGNMPTNLEYFMDLDFKIRCLMEGQCLYLPGSTIRYVRHKGQACMGSYRRLAETKDREYRTVRENMLARYAVLFSQAYPKLNG
jgi:glycosyltransferase involved in cell wall biosynthesis